MKRRIHKYDYINGIITCIIEDRLVNFYLTNSIKRRFGDLLEEGCYITFKPNFKTKRIINKQKCYRINYFLKIELPTYRTTKIVYDINILREQVIDYITKDKYYLFLDLEMTMPPYYKVHNFQPEIIQVGYYLTDDDQNILEENSYYLTPTKFKTVSKRTLKFLNLKRGAIKNPKPYIHFYNDLKRLLKQYKPKIVVWGNNDYLAIKQSFKINKQRPLLNRQSFLNLLNSIKRYYNLFDDVGLFKAYEIYYKKAPVQKHDALNDAYVLYKIYQSFIRREKEEEFSKLE